MLIDTHTHINSNAFEDDGEEIIKKTLENDIWIIMPGSQHSTSKRAVEIAERYEQGVYAAIGIHPIHLGEKRKVDVWEVQSEEVSEKPWMTFEARTEEFGYEKYKELARHEKVVAIGEIGLDYYYFPKSKAKREGIKEKQKNVLEQQLDLADEMNLPVIIHCRNAFDDMYSLLEARFKSRASKPNGVIHSYTGDGELAQKFIKLGFFIGFNGLIFKDVPALPNPEEVISSIPLENIVLETDAPYLMPPLPVEALSKEGQAGVERNEPLFVKYVAEEIARIKSIDFDEVADATTKNAKSLFSL